MSGICGLFNLDGAPVAKNDIGSMCSMLERRGPDGTNTWQDSTVALGHTLLIATPEAENEHQPFQHEETGCVITADIRLDNRADLYAALPIRRDLDSVSDAEIVLHSYLKWGDQCPNRLLGDFAFAIWDPRKRRIFCARDHFGMRSLYYHHAPGQRFVVGSSTDAILALKDIPYRLNEARIADYLILELEWVDYTCTFFKDVFRLPPAHTAIVTEQQLIIEPYWHPDPCSDPGPMSDDDWCDGLLEVLTRSVDARLRAPTGKVGSMLSGGMDSGSIVAIARDLLHERGAGKLPTFSAVRGTTETAEKKNCAESLAIYASTELPHIQPTLVSPDSSSDDLELMLTGFEEPFDTGFMFLKKIYAAAADQDICVVLDGGGGDIVLGEGSYVSRLIRSGELRRAWTEILAESRVCERRFASLLTRYGRAALLPDSVKRPMRQFLDERRTTKKIRASLVSPELADRVNLHGRFQRMRETFAIDRSGDLALETVQSVMPNMTAGKERYARIAASCAIEARDPFMDRRLVEYCAHIPGHLRVREYQHKFILRKIMDGRVPNEVTWAGRKPHIGWLFNQAVKKQLHADGHLTPDLLRNTLRDWVDASALDRSWRKFEYYGYDEDINTAMCLSAWLRQ